MGVVLTGQVRLVVLKLAGDGEGVTVPSGDGSNSAVTTIEPVDTLTANVLSICETVDVSTALSAFALGCDLSAKATRAPALAPAPAPAPAPDALMQMLQFKGTQVRPPCCLRCV